MKYQSDMILGEIQAVALNATHQNTGDYKSCDPAWQMVFLK